MRISAFLAVGCAGLFLASCQQQSTASTTESGADNSGSFAMRVPAAVVAAGSGIVDSVTLRIVPLNSPASAIVKSWPLKEEELLFESLPATRCSVSVKMPRKDLGGNMFTGGAVVDIRPGRTTQADINLTQTTGSLSLNLKIDAYNTNAAPPTASPAAGLYTSAQTITLTHSVAGTVMQYRLESAATGATAPWTTYASPFTIAQTSVLYVRAINGTDTGAIKSSTYLVSYGKVLNNFETAYGNAIGWNGSVYKGSSTTLASVTGSRIAAGPWGSASARISYVLDGTDWSGYAGGIFNSKGIDWTRLKAIRLKLRSNVTRPVTVAVLSSHSVYADSYLRYRFSLRTTTSSNEFTINRSDLALPEWGSVPANFPSLEAILPTVTGLDVMVECTNSTGTCSNEAGTLDVDDIIVDLN